MAKTEKTIEKKEVIDVNLGKEFDFVKSPCITEKASFLTEKNFYSFKVDPRANKIQIKDFIEKKYKVNVESVRIVNLPKKPKKRGVLKGYKSGYKKAIVKVKEGQQIDITVN